MDNALYNRCEICYEFINRYGCACTQVILKRNRIPLMPGAHLPKEAPGGCLNCGKDLEHKESVYCTAHCLNIHKRVKDTKNTEKLLKRFIPIWDKPTKSLSQEEINECLIEIWENEFKFKEAYISNAESWHIDDFAGWVLGPLMLRYKIDINYYPKCIVARYDYQGKITCRFEGESAPRAISLAIIEYYKKYRKDEINKTI